MPIKIAVLQSSVISPELMGEDKAKNNIHTKAVNDEIWILDSH